MQPSACVQDKKRVCAGIVLYNANSERLIQNIDSIINQVESLILVDNGSKNIDEIKKKLDEKYDDKISFKFSKENKGIAWALNNILEYAKSNEFEWFITLDQDSVCSPELVNRYLKYIDKSIGQITCNIIDRNLGQIDNILNEGSGLKEVEHCITSGCINQTSAINCCGGYNEGLFIDGVDIDVSCNLRLHGYKIIQIDYCGLLHELGNGRTKMFFGKPISIAYHIPWRNYYTRRNIIYVARRYYSGIKKWKIIIKQILYGIGAVVLEDKKVERFKCNFKGIIDGFKMKN